MQNDNFILSPGRGTPADVLPDVIHMEVGEPSAESRLCAIAARVEAELTVAKAKAPDDDAMIAPIKPLPPDL